MALDDWEEIGGPGRPAKGGKRRRPELEFPAVPPRRRRGFSFGVRHIMGLVLLSAILVWVGQRVGLVALLVLGFAVLIGAGIGSIALLIRGAAAPRESMLWLVANAAEKGMPLPEGVLAIGALSGGSFRARANRLAEVLNSGATLPDALDEVPGSFPAGALVYTRMGWPPHDLARALREAGSTRSVDRALGQSWTVRIGYLIWTLIILQAIYTWMIYWIAPKFEDIFNDFGVDLPAITRIVFGFSHKVVGSGLLPILLLAELAILPLLPLVFFDPLHWNVPILDRWMRRRHGGIVARVLATEVEAGRPLSRAIETLGLRYPSSFIKGRLAAAARDVQGGAPWADSLVDVGLIRRVDADVLRAAERVGNLPWALRDLAGGVERRFLHRLMAWTQVAFPVAIITLAALVLAFAVAFFLPLVRLIEELS